jgi:hypothetical protein
MPSLAELVDAPQQTRELASSQGLPPAHVRIDGKSSYANDYAEAVSEWTDGVYSSSCALMAQEPECQEISRYIKILLGSHWLSSRPSYRSQIVVNKLLSFFYQQLAILSDVKANQSVETDNHELRTLAQNLTKLSYSNWIAQDADIALLYTLMHASLTGIGWTKVGFNPTEQEVTFLPLGPDSVIPVLPCQTDFQQSGGVIYRVWKPVAWAKDRFPQMWKHIKPEALPWSSKFPQRPYDVPEYTWNNLNPGWREFLAGDYMGKAASERGSVPMFLYNEFWFQDPQINTTLKPMDVGWGNYSYVVRPGEQIFPFGRLICTAGTTNRVILYDNTNIHWHGQFPFVPLRLRPLPWVFGGISDFRDLFPINHAINQMAADAQDLLKQVLNPVVLSRDRQISPESWDEYFPGMPGAKLKVLGQGPLSEVIQFQRPSEGPLAPLVQFIQLFSTFFEQQSGLTDMGRALQKKQVPGENTLDTIRDAQQNVFRLKGRFIELWQRGIGRLQVSDLSQYVTRRKVIQTLGPGGETQTYLDYDPATAVPYMTGTEPFRRGKDFVDKFRMSVVAGSALQSQRREMASLVMSLAAQHKVSTEFLYKILTLVGIPMPLWSEELEKIKKELSELPMMPAKGQRQPRMQR